MGPSPICHQARVPCAKFRLQSSSSLLAPGTVGQSQDHIPWLIVDDMQLVSLLPGVGGSGTKDMLTVADVMCRITRERGVTESKVVDHDLDAKKTAACQVLCRFCKLVSARGCHFIVNDNCVDRSLGSAENQFVLQRSLLNSKPSWPSSPINFVFWFSVFSGLSWLPTPPFRLTPTEQVGP